MLLLGACVAPSVGDAYCGPGARYGTGGCAFVKCNEGYELDLSTGSCVRNVSVVHVCLTPGAAVIESGEERCLPPEVTCPRGTRRDGWSCVRPRDCPAGTIPTKDGCRSVVSNQAARGTPRVDVGAWTALVVGTDGGSGSPELCRPLALHPTALGVPAGGVANLELRVALSIPDADVSRVHAAVSVPQPPNPTSGQGSAEAMASAALAPLVEALRGLGGESSATDVEVQVFCAVAARP